MKLLAILLFWVLVLVGWCAFRAGGDINPYHWHQDLLLGFVMAFWIGVLVIWLTYSLRNAPTDPEELVCQASTPAAPSALPFKDTLNARGYDAVVKEWAVEEQANRHLLREINAAVGKAERVFAVEMLIEERGQLWLVGLGETELLKGDERNHRARMRTMRSPVDARDPVWARIIEALKKCRTMP